MRNPFVSDRFIEGEPCWPAFHQEILERLTVAVRAMGTTCEPGGCAAPGRVILVRARRGGMGKSHLAARLAESLREEFAVTSAEIRPESLREWERNWDKRMQGAGDRHLRHLLVLDHLDAFYGKTGAGMRIARLVERFVSAHPGSVGLLLVNRDMWKDLFASQLPSALRDLLTWEVQEVPPATAGEAEGLVIHRLETAGVEDHVILQFLERLDLEKMSGKAGCKGLSPREIFRAARVEWQAFGGEEMVRGTGERTATVPFCTPLTGTDGSSAAARTDLWPAADQARSHLHAVAEALRRQSAPRTPAENTPPGAGVLRLLEPPGLETQGGGGLEIPAVPNRKRERSATLPEVFQELRLRFLRKGPLSYQPELVYGLLSRVGERFPSIRQRVVGETLPVEERVLEWCMFGRRIWIGVAPISSCEVWDRTRQIWSASARSSQPSKLVGFGAPGGDSLGGGAEVDLIEPGPDLLATLYAAEELLRQSRSLAPEASEVRITGFLASELDHFWSRLTRLPARREANPAPEEMVST